MYNDGNDNNDVYMCVYTYIGMSHVRLVGKGLDSAVP